MPQQSYFAPLVIDVVAILIYDANPAGVRAYSGSPALGHLASNSSVKTSATPMRA